MTFKKCLIGLCGMLAMTSANAAIITQFGSNVKFTYDDSTLFGTGTVVGNSIFFTPDNFIAESLNGAGSTLTTDLIDIVIESTTSGYTMEKYVLAESGDYISDGTGASVSADAFLQVNSNTTICGLFFPCMAQEIYSAGSLSDTGGGLAFWNLGGAIDLADTAGWGSDTSVTVTLQNTLQAETLNTGETAFIQKKNGAIGIQVVPVPAAVWLFASGLLGLVGVARRNTDI